MHLDVARNFVEKDEVEKLLNVSARDRLYCIVNNVNVLDAEWI